MRIFSLALLLALSGCTTVRYQRVYCVTKAQVEQLQKPSPARSATSLPARLTKI
jgi:outer membrane protein assembly factor BamE (lipoprotein component of BamABCDE complex)